MVSKAALELILRARDEASRTLRGANETLGGLGATAARIAKGGLALAAGATAAVGTASLAAGVAIGKMAVDAAPIQGISNAFETLNDNADEALARLRAGSSNMIRDADLMRNYNDATQMVSQSFANDLPEAMQYMQKISASTGKDLDMLLGSWTEGIGKLSPMILDNLNIQVDATAANEAYAAATGKLVEELTEAEQQEALTAQALQMLKENTAALPDTTGTAAQSMAQLKAAFQNAKDGIGAAFLPALQSLMGPLADLGVKYGPQVVEWAEIAGEWMADKLPEAVEAISNKWREFFPQARDTVVEFWNRIRPGLEWIRDIFMNYYATYIPHLREAWDRLRAEFEKIREMVVTKLKPAWDRLTESLGGGEEQTGSFMKMMGDLAGLLMRVNVEAIILGIKGAVELLTAAFNVVAIGIEAFRAGLDGVRNAAQWVQDRIDGLRGSLSGLRIPDWLTPGSPTPFEMGLRGIGDALDHLPDLNAQFSVGAASAPMAMAGVGGGGGVVQITNHFGPGSVRSDDDIEAIARRQEEILNIRGVRNWEV